MIDNRFFLSSGITARLVESRTATPKFSEESPFEKLTVTERRILKVLASGKSNKEIAAELAMNHRTIENHRSNICRKLKIEGASSLLRFEAATQRQALIFTNC